MGQMDPTKHEDIYHIESDLDPDQKLAAIHQVFGLDCVVLERAARAYAMRYSTCTDLSVMWAFARNPDGSLGFWFPLQKHGYEVLVESNGFRSEDMGAEELGAACTLTAVNHYNWHLAERLQNEQHLDEAERADLEERSDRMADLFIALRGWIGDLDDRKLLNGSLVFDFID